MTNKTKTRLKQKLTRREVLSHFHPLSINYGGWNLVVRPEELDVEFIKSEFKDMINAEVQSDGRVLLSKVNKKSFSDKHTIEVLKYKVDVYKREADKYYNTMKKLVG